MAKPQTLLGGDNADWAATDSTPQEESQKWTRELLSADEQRTLQKRSDAQGILQSAGNLALVLGLGLVSATHPSFAVRLAARLAAAFCAAFLFNAFHECVHNTAFKTVGLNKAMGQLCGFLMTRPLQHYIYYHYAHHKYTGDTERDPELQYSFIDPKIDSVPSYLFYLSGVSFWLDRGLTLFRHGVLEHFLPREGFVPPSHRKFITKEARLFLAGYACVAALVVYGPPLARDLILWGWFAVFLTAQPILNFFLVAEHTGCTQNAQMLMNTRTTLSLWVLRRLSWNMSFHAEHHLFPYVPFFRLADLHQAINDKPGVKREGCSPTGDHGYLHFHARLIASFFDKKKED